MIVGVVGNRKGIPEHVVKNALDKLLKHIDNPAIISGAAQGVDTYAKNYAINEKMWFIECCPCGNIRVFDFSRKSYTPCCITTSSRFTKDEFFDTNYSIAYLSEALICFIVKGRLRSGTLNTIRHFNDLKKEEFGIYDSNGKEWEFQEFPKWLKNRLSFT